MVNQGDSLLSISEDPLVGAAYVPVFLGNKEMAQVFPGMQVLATPSGFRRAEFGGIVGRVISLEKMPSGEADITARVGSKALTDLILRREPSPTLAVVALQREQGNQYSNRGGYRWSSPSNLPFPPTPGDRLEVEITTRRVHPIQLVLPALRRFLGLAPPHQPVSGLGAGNSPTPK